MAAQITIPEITEHLDVRLKGRTEGRRCDEAPVPTAACPDNYMGYIGRHFKFFTEKQG